MSKKRLSILIYSLAGGGAERVVSILLNELKDRYDIRLVLMRDKIEYNIPIDIPIELLDNSNPYEKGIIKFLKLPYLGWKYKKFCQKNAIDVSLSFMNRPNYINIFAKLFGIKSKVIISERVSPLQEYKTEGLKDRISKFLIRYLYPKADLIIPNSKGIEIDLRDNFNIKENTKVINNPIDIDKVVKKQKEFIDIELKRFSFITVGRLQRQKNHRLLIDSLKDVDANLYIIGEGELREELEKQIEELELKNRVFLLGFKNNPYKYLSKADTFIFSSNYEGFPNAILEALACGLPIISSDCKSGPREILAPNSDVSFQLDKDNLELSEYGILTTINSKRSLVEAMNLLINNEKLRDSYNKKARLRANYFNKTKIITEFLKIIDSN